MALTYKSLLFESQILSSGTNDDLFDLTDANTSVDNLVVRVTNVTGTAATVTIWSQVSAGAEADADKVAVRVVPADDFIDIDCPRMVGGSNKAKLTATASAASTLSISLLDGVLRTT